MLTTEATTEVAIVETGARATVDATTSELMVTQSQTVVSVQQVLPVAPQQFLLPVEGIDDELNDETLRIVEGKRLYSLGRFKTDEELVSLSWVSIAPLINQKGYSPVVVNAMARWLKQKMLLETGASTSGSILMGIDSWGDVLASQLAVMSSGVSSAFQPRSANETHISRFAARQIRKVPKGSTIILVTDVVATGRSLRTAYERISTWLKADVAASVRWMALSVICDPHQARTVDCRFLASHGTVCWRLPMPLVPAAQLPLETILPTTLSLTS